MRKVVAVLLALFTVSSVYALSGTLELKVVDGPDITLRQPQAQEWTLKRSDVTFSLRRDSSSLTFSREGTRIAEGRIDGDKIKLKNLNGGYFVTIKNYDKKIKIYDAEESVNPWEIKFYSDKIKLKRSDKTLAQVKYYKDTGKIKVKNNDNTMLEFKGFQYAPAFAAAIAINELSDEQYNCVILLLLSQGR